MFIFTIMIPVSSFSECKGAEEKTAFWINAMQMLDVKLIRMSELMKSWKLSEAQIAFKVVNYFNVIHFFAF
jgi:hypothetical protein